MLNKRTLLLGGAAIAAGAAYPVLSRFGRTTAGSGDAVAGANTAFEIKRTEEEWRGLLTPDRFAVLREEATERPYTSPLLEEKRTGAYHCAGCDLALYRSETKFDSGTGWPSFYEAMENAVGTRTDYKLFLARTEVHCRRCGSHQGHIFDDGPAPTGKRHCINGLAMTFKPDSA